MFIVTIKKKVVFVTWGTSLESNPPGIDVDEHRQFGSRHNSSLQLSAKSRRSPDFGAPNAKATRHPSNTIFNIISMKIVTKYILTATQEKTLKLVYSYCKCAVLYTLLRVLIYTQLISYYQVQSLKI